MSSSPPNSLSQNSGGDRGRRGLTLFEVLVVISMLATLVTLVIGLGRYADLTAKRHQAIADLGKWQDALQRYYEFYNWGEYPVPGQTDVSNLLTYAACDTSGTLTNHFCERLLTQQIQLYDPWGTNYQYVVNTTNAPQCFDLYSCGPDHQGNTSDDIRFQP